MISNTWKYIEDNYVDLGLMAICFCMPFKVLLLSRVIMFTLLLSIIHAIINRKSFSVSKQHIQKVAVIMLLLSVNGISLIYSTDKAYAFKLGSTIVGLFTLPFIFLIYKPNLPGKFYFNSFLLGTATASLIMIISFQINHGFIEVFKKAADSTYSYFQVLHYYDLSSFIHRSYISLFIQFYLVYLIHSITKLRHKLPHLITAFFLLSFMILLNSRTAYMVLIVLFLIVVFKIFARKKILISILGLALCLACSFVIVKYTRLGDTIKKVSQNYKTSDIRYKLWSNSVELIKEKPLFGYGIGDADEVLHNLNKQKKVSITDEHKLNAHNQFLQTTLQTGIIGLILLILVFALPVYNAIRKKQELLLLFLVIVFINFFFESMLQRLAGVTFFAFWYSYLVLIYHKNQKTTL